MVRAGVEGIPHSGSFVDIMKSRIQEKGKALLIFQCVTVATPGPRDQIQVGGLIFEESELIFEQPPVKMRFVFLALDR